MLVINASLEMKDPNSLEIAEGGIVRINDGESFSELAIRINASNPVRSWNREYGVGKTLAGLPDGCYVYYLDSKKDCATVFGDIIGDRGSKATVGDYRLFKVSSDGAGTYTLEIKKQAGEEQEETTVLKQSGTLEANQTIVIRVNVAGDYDTSAGNIWPGSTDNEENGFKPEKPFDEGNYSWYWTKNEETSANKNGSFWVDGDYSYGVNEGEEPEEPEEP